jgi:hypothetical protein
MNIQRKLFPVAQLFSPDTACRCEPFKIGGTR